MKREIKNIMFPQSPSSRKIEDAKSSPMRPLLVVALFEIGLLIVILICLFICLTEGHIEFDDKHFSYQETALFAIAILLAMICTGITCATITLESIHNTLSTSQIEIADHSYKTMLLTEQLLLELREDEENETNSASNKNSDICPPQAQPTLSKSPAIPVRIVKDSEGRITCPRCELSQSGDRYRCSNCGQYFINGQPNIPYWCGSCGKEGPFADHCPNCQSSLKLFNSSN